MWFDNAVILSSQDVSTYIVTSRKRESLIMDASQLTANQKDEFIDQYKQQLAVAQTQELLTVNNVDLIDFIIPPNLPKPPPPDTDPFRKRSSLADDD